ncbi:MAG: GNAT family N-acetyltransferase [Candidatus Acidiferrales bacterium]
MEDLETLRPDWERLLMAFPGASIFSSWEWLASWWRAFGEGQSLHVLTFQNSGSRLAGMAPLSLATYRSLGIRWRVVRLMGDGSKDSDNLDLPVLPGYEEEFVGSLLGHLQKHSQWDFCEWNTMPDNSPLAIVLPTLLKNRGWPLITTFTPCSSISLPDNWDAYVKQLSVNQRGNLRKMRRLEKLYEVQYRRCSGKQDLQRDLPHLFELHQLRWKAEGQSGSFRSTARRRFYYELANLLLSRNQLEFWLLELNGRPVAAQFGFRFGHTVYLLQEGFDPNLAKDSIGYVLRAHVLRTLIAEGIRTYDFLGGVSDSKARWGAHVHRYVNLQFARPQTAGSFYIRARYGLKEGKESLRSSLSPRLWAFLHAVNVRVRGGRR